MIYTNGGTMGGYRFLGDIAIVQGLTAPMTLESTGHFLAAKNCTNYRVKVDNSIFDEGQETIHVIYGT